MSKQQHKNVNCKRDFTEENEVWVMSPRIAY